MVQMKAFLEPKRYCPKLFLYIPHGSDERKPVPQARPRFYTLYIPHGSDESSKK